MTSLRKKSTFSTTLVSIDPRNLVRTIFVFLIHLFCLDLNAEQTSLSEIYLGSREGDPASLVENVSIIHGDYTEVEVDVTVPAPDSLVLSRYYSSRDTLPIATFGGWRFNPHCFLTMQTAPRTETGSSSEGTSECTLVYLGNSDGSILTYAVRGIIAGDANRVLFQINADVECAGITNNSKGSIGAWTNRKNDELYYNLQSDSFELSLSNEGKRFYAKSSIANFYVITHEILPSGNKIFYQFDEKNQLVLIKETNASEKKVLGWIKLTYENCIRVETSDGKTVNYLFQSDLSGTQLLTSVMRSDKPNLRYQYQVANDRALLVQKTLPEGRFVHIEYDMSSANAYKVKTVTTPIATDRTSKVHFAYDQKETQVSGPGCRKTVYHHNENLQLIAVEQYLDGVLYRVHKKSWGTKDDIGNLICTSLADAFGNVFHHKRLIYDKKGNIKEEREYGDIAGSGAIALEFTDKGFVTNHDGNVRTFSYFSGKNTHGYFNRDARGTGVKYWYKKGSNLLVKKFILTSGSADSEEEDYRSGIKQRFFYTYDDNATLIAVVVDDGSPMQYSWQSCNITQRLMTKISPKMELPNIGAPEIIEQKSTTPDGESEFLIKKIINHFNPQGNVMAQDIYDAEDNYRYTIKKQYSHGRLISETDPLGYETSYAYDGNGNLLAETHAATGRSIEYGYDLRNRRTHVNETDSSGSRLESAITYDGSGYKSSEKDRYGNLTLYDNDSLGRPIRITYPETSNGYHACLAPTYTITYDLFDHPLSTTDPKGQVLKTSYNLRGKPADIYYPDQTMESCRYDSSGHLHHRTRRDGILEVFEYDYIGRLYKVSYCRKGAAPGFAFMNEHSNFSSLHKTATFDRRGNKTAYIYDRNGRLASMKKGDQQIDFSYDALGRTQGVKKWKSATEFTLEIREYDLLDRVIEERIESTSGKVLMLKRYIYNNVGELAQIIGYPQNRESVLMQLEYDHFGRLIQASGASGNITQISYDDLYVTSWGQRGCKRTIVDPLGNCTEEILDQDGHLIQDSKRSIGGTLLSHQETAYDYLGNQLLGKAAVMTAEGQNGDFAVTYTYAPKKQLETTTLGEGSGNERVTRFENNLNGQLVKKVLPGIQSSVLYKYNAYSQLEEVTCTQEEMASKYAPFYDFNDNLTALNQDGLALFYKYDDNDLPTLEVVEDIFGRYAVGRIYDGEGKVKTIKLPDGSYVDYNYEGPLVKNVSRFNRNGKYLYTYAVNSRDLMGNLTEEVLPGHAGTRTQTWDEAGRRVGIVTTVFSDEVVEYDLLDSIKKRVIFFDGKQQSIEYQYNPLQQLLAEKGDVEHHYSYDSIGNRLRKDNSFYNVNSLNELIAAEGYTYTYHFNGTVATKALDGWWTWLFGKPKWVYQSNALNQLLSIKAGSTTVEFAYDLTGKRYRKHVTSNRSKQVRRFFYIDDTEIGCLNEKGEIVELKIPSNPNDPESPAIAIEIKNETYVPLYDLQGNVACLIDAANGRLVETYRYSAYGEVTIRNSEGRLTTNSVACNPWMFKGKRMDNEVGLVYFGYRYYDPAIGRWISPDPMSTIDGPNLYAFVRNNPVKYVDYFGLASEVDPNCGCTIHGHPGRTNAPPDCVCICEDPVSGGPQVYRAAIGSDIVSIMGGATHGLVDFMVGSFHDLETTAVYIGSADLDINLYERAYMIQAVERSQLQRMAELENYLMNMMEIGESDSLYQSVRYNTTTGLEIGSLVYGGYGLVKSAISFTKVTKVLTVSSNITKPLKLSQWPSPAHGRSIINGIEYTTHALERMAPRGLVQNSTNIISRGVPPSVVENAINFGAKTVANTPHEIVHVFENVRVVTNLDSTRVITVITTGK